MKTLILTVGSFFIIGSSIAQEDDREWEERAPIPSDARHHPVTFSLDGTGYLLGGTTGYGPEQSDLINFANRDFYSYNAETDTWTSLGNYPGPGRSFSYADTYNGKAYIGFGAGNVYLNDLWEYDPAADEWTELASCPCDGRRHPAFIAHRGKIFVGMGDNNGNLNDWWEYDIDINSWRQLPDLPGEVRHHPFHFKAGDHVYAGLGHGNNIVILNDWYKWDIDEEEWIQMNNFPDQARVAGTEFSFEGHGYVLSGDGSDHQEMDEGEFWKYDHEADNWEQLFSHPGLSRWAPGSFVIHDSVYFIAGYIRDGKNQGFKKDMMRFPLKEGPPVSTEELANNKAGFKLYPNPAKNTLRFNREFVNEYDQLEIFNISGSMVTSRTVSHSEIDVSQLPGGMYILKLKNNEGASLQERFIKK